MPRRLFLVLVFFSAGLTVSGSLAAEQVYVKDSLRIGMRAEPGTATPPISVVTTGMKLDIIERDGIYVKVKTPSGIEGWIKATYVSESAPSMIKLEELQVKFQALKSQQEKQGQHVEATALNNKNLSAEIEQLKQANAELRIQLQDETQAGLATGLAYEWKIGLLLILAIGGFAVGAAWYRKQTMKRLGGLRF